MKKPYIYMLTGAVLLSLFMIWFFHFSDRHQAVFRDLPPGIMENSGDIVVGLYEPNGKLIEEGSVLKYPENGQLHKVVSLNHLFDKPGDYGLMILQDFHQVKFEADGKKYLMYPFNVEPNHTVNIQTKVKIEKGVKELDYLIIKKPKTC